MRNITLNQLLGTIATAATLCGAPATALSQPQNAQNDSGVRGRLASAATDADDDDVRVNYTFKSRTDSLSWARNRGLAKRRTSGMRVVVSLQDRHLWAIIGVDTVLSAPAAVAKGTTLEFGNSKWKFVTPRGQRTVLGKEADPIWQPPEWLYAETALENGLKLGHVYEGKPIRLSDGRILTIRNGYVGLIENGQFGALPTDEHIVFQRTLYVPPLGTYNRKVEGELGKYRLILGDGYLLHGTPYKASIGMAATHGCIRLRDEDIEWLYENVPVGTKVYIY
jgi:L,D-transpeptidase catalytic domain